MQGKLGLDFPSGCKENLDSTTQFKFIETSACTAFEGVKV